MKAEAETLRVWIKFLSVGRRFSFVQIIYIYIYIYTKITVWCEDEERSLPLQVLNRIFNRHTVRISYSCTSNMKSFLDKHNKIILKKHTNRLNKDDEKLCNCRQRVNCPTDGKCLTRSVLYKAEVTSTDNNTTQTYIGVTAKDFKTRYRNHLKSLRNKEYKH